ncbi:DUF6493 family protein [Actinomadura sp. WAC 06369]|uniref:DUF6493 family protein n=1 Tax=Actinomadura sp. WAC 06369 TaxID=2203193 RepID=UPI000F76CAC5|nr:DUF6493 family protein [Actinomadura sp. WAC 06369]RSN69164.1 hypothetical protein DMH08_09160 [Actinomadura sp. WAC 06369]
MTAWDDVRGAIEAKDQGRVIALAAKLDGAGRREVADALPGLLRELRAKAEWNVLERGYVEPLLLAGAGTIGGASAAAAWLCRRELEVWPMRFARGGLQHDLVKVTAARPAEWRADVGRRIADRLRAGDDRMGSLWPIAAEFTLSAGAAAPASDGFVAGWAALADPAALADDPFLDALVPRLFDADGVGGALADDEIRVRWDRERTTNWAEALAGLAAAGRLDRAALIDGCVGRFLRGGTSHELRFFVRLHDLLDPSDEEAAARVRDHVRLLPAAPSTVAGLALRQVRRADDLGRLDAGLFAEAADALAFRPEKKLVRAALGWLDRTARKRDRVDATVRAVTAVFATEALDLRERAVKIAVKHAGRVDAATRETVRDAAAGLPADLRAALAAGYGAVDAGAEPAPVPSGPPPYVPRALPAPIASLAELAEEFRAQQHATFAWVATERFLAALVESAFTDPSGTREALRPHVQVDLSEHHRLHSSTRAAHYWAALAGQMLVRPFPVEPPAARWFDTRRTGVDGPPVRRLLLWRKREIIASVGRTPVLLAAPTEGSGHIAPMTLVERLERLEAAGVEPGRADLAQALLRIPRDVDPDAAIRAESLVSEAGRTVAPLLASGGLPDPVVQCRRLDEPLRTERGRVPKPPPHGVVSVASPGDGLPEPLSELWSYDAKFTAGHDCGGTESWPALLPSHRELAAAHALPHQFDPYEYASGQGATALALAAADGPAGAATAAVLAYALAHRDARERADAVEAFLVFAARGHLPAAGTGTALGTLARSGAITPNRAVRSLAEAADAGAHAGVWPVIAAVLPALLPEPGTRAPSGLPDLLALGARTAESVRARDEVPGLAEVAARGGSSRLVTEAARLHRVLTGA